MKADEAQFRTIFDNLTALEREFGESKRDQVAFWNALKNLADEVGDEDWWKRGGNSD